MKDDDELSDDRIDTDDEVTDNEIGPDDLALIQMTDQIKKGTSKLDKKLEQYKPKKIIYDPYSNPDPVHGTVKQFFLL